MSNPCAAGRQLSSTRDPDWLLPCPEEGTNILIVADSDEPDTQTVALYMCPGHIALLPDLERLA